MRSNPVLGLRQLMLRVHTDACDRNDTSLQIWDLVKRQPLLTAEVNTIRIWSLENGAHLRMIKGHCSYINSALALDKAGKALISGGTGIPLKIWSVANSLG
jgi:WD40 repeat protein